MLGRNFILALVVAISVFAIGGCRTAPIYNVKAAPISAPDLTEVKMEDVKVAIFRAGAQLGWRMQLVEEGHIVGTLHLRRHTAEIDITYDVETYNIVYRDSKNLNYRDDDHIHSNYNGWIQNLDREVQSQLNMLYL